MRLSLLYHSDAGEGVSAEELRQLFERSGHQLVHVFEDESDLHDVLEDSVDLVVAAGGDGTVRRAVTVLVGKGVPLAILPLGTANNIATCLGLGDSVEDVVKSWDSERLRPLDLGKIRGEWGSAWFVEGVGSGLITSAITTLEKDPSLIDGPDADSRLALAVRGFRQVLAELPLRRWTITIDGEQFEGEFLLAEILNIGSVGPNLALSPAADPADGLFDVVLAGENHRAELGAYLDGRIRGAESRLSLPRRRARRVEVSGWEELHVDDQIISGPPIGIVTIEMEKGALKLLG